MLILNMSAFLSRLFAPCVKCKHDQVFVACAEWEG